MMWHDAYAENLVLSADPVQLVCLVYELALASVKHARRCLAAGDIAQRALHVSRAIAAISELENSLDHEAGLAVSRKLSNLYGYMRQRLTDANMNRQDGPLQEVESLINTLSEAWQGVRNLPSRQPETKSPAGSAGQSGPWDGVEVGLSHDWSA